MQFLKCTLAVLLAAPIFGSDGTPTLAPAMTVHEWGTFTSVAGDSGGPQAWTVLGGKADLPCFVFHLEGRNYKVIPSTTTHPGTDAANVRMETPVLYFYSPRKSTVSVSVDFPHGLITEWFPPAQVTPDALMPNLSPRYGHIAWDHVEVLPGEDPEFPMGHGDSHYYAARHTDSDPLRTATRTEKLLFYRGIASMNVPLWARMAGDSQVELRNTGQDALTLSILFENRGGKIGYRIVRDLQDTRQVEMPGLTADLPALKEQLAAELTAAGLYPKEAAAMIETWRDSWFEEGLRVFYLAPRTMVDQELPLTIKPAPKAIQRVFLGRVEILSPTMRQTLSQALTAGDVDTLQKFGRFLEPFREQLRGVPLAAKTNAYLSAQRDSATAAFYAPSCVQ